MSQDYAQRLRLPLQGSRIMKQVLTLGGVPIARRYQRVVIGGRGPYVEFLGDDLFAFNMRPTDAPHRYFVEWRTLDGVKVYEQRERVDYADYIPGRFYISPFELTYDVEPFITPLKGEDPQLGLLLDPKGGR